MALETLKEVFKIGDFGITRVDWRQNAENFIEINDNHNAITFKLQSGPIQEHGVNGCQVDTIIEAAMMILDGLSEQVECIETDMASTHLEIALMWLAIRKRDRMRRGVEGKNEA